MKKATFLSILLIISTLAFSQIAPNTYVIKFKDKKNTKYSIENPEKFLSQKSIERRKKYKIAITEQDLPVNQEYITELENLGLEIKAVSKWMNLVVVYAKKKKLVKKARKLDFVDNSKFKHQKQEKMMPEKFKKPDIKFAKDTSFAFDYGLGKNQIVMLNGHYLHNREFQGQGMEIAVLDAGFYHVNELKSFDSLRINNQILGIKDFIDKDGDVYKNDTHGMMVLSTMGGNLPGKLVGTAPKAKYWLFRTEQEKSEYIVEEYYWLNAAEYADSIGVDMIHTSLGYNDFDDKINSHEYKDMDGNTAPISIAADIASSKGILVVTSAGNEGNDPWKYVSAPADADSVLAVGSVGAGGTISDFSSRGPSFDGRVKPDVMAQGSFAFVQGRRGGITFSFGTSFSGPILAGCVACLWQANPDFNNMQIIDAVKKSCSIYDNPNGDYGYGIPNFAWADAYLKSLSKKQNIHKVEKMQNNKEK